MGFLTPYSSIYPNFFPHIASGFYLGLGQKAGKRSDIEILPEFAGSGSKGAFEDAFKKLLQFSNVDIISGMVSYRTIPDMVSLLEKNNKIGAFFDMGELTPNFDYHSPNMFFNSHQLYQSQFALGYWAEKTYKQPGQIITPIYNSGYQLHNAFYAGIKAAGGAVTLQTIIPYKENDPHHLDIDSVFKEMRKNPPAYVHALFVGPQGNEFLAKWKTETWAKDIPLLVAENMLYDDMLSDVKHLNLELYGASLWNPKSEKKENKFFTKKFLATTGQPPNFYALMGYEMGLLFKEVLKPLKKRDWDTVKTFMQNTIIEGPRGEVSFYPKTGLATPQMDIIKVKTGHTGINSMIIDSGKKLDLQSPEAMSLKIKSESGWLNPYLCI